jgi:hypothetical protein
VSEEQPDVVVLDQDEALRERLCSIGFALLGQSEPL